MQCQKGIIESSCLPANPAIPTLGLAGSTGKEEEGQWWKGINELVRGDGDLQEMVMLRLG